jgi:hypothetical protein
MPATGPFDSQQKMVAISAHKSSSANALLTELGIGMEFISGRGCVSWGRHGSVPDGNRWRVTGDEPLNAAGP